MALNLSQRMAWKIVLTGLWLATSLALLTACNKDAVTNPSPTTDPSLTQDHWTVIDINKTNHDQGSVVLTKVLTSTNDVLTDASTTIDGAFVSAMHLAITPQTVIVDDQGRPMTLSDLSVGMLTNITLNEPLTESYPLQGTAQKVIVTPRDGRVRQPEGWVSPEEAIQKALQDIRQDGATIWGVSDIQITADAQATSGSNGEFVPNVWFIAFLKGPDIDMDTPAQSPTTSDNELQTINELQTMRAITVDGQAGTVKNTIVAWNDTFRLYSPDPGSMITPSFNIHGEARIFEGAFNYNLEDGHNILATGTIHASQGAPGWGTFDVTISFDPSSTEPYLTQTLILYEVSPKDGSPMHQLVIPLHLSRQKTP